MWILDYQKEGKDQERFYSWLIIKEKGSKGLPIGCESCYLDKDSKVKIIYQKEKIDIKVAIFYLNSLIALLIVNSPAVKNPDWYVNEVQDDASISWRKRKKHFFILSHSGKPIYSRFHFWLYYGWSFFVHQLKKNINLSQLFYQIWRRTQACWVFCNITSHHFFCWKWVRLLSYQRTCLIIQRRCFLASSLFDAIEDIEYISSSMSFQRRPCQIGQSRKTSGDLTGAYSWIDLSFLCEISSAITYWTQLELLFLTLAGVVIPFVLEETCKSFYGDFMVSAYICSLLSMWMWLLNNVLLVLSEKRFVLYLMWWR